MRRKEGMAKVVDSNDGVQAVEAAGAAAGARPAFDLHGEYRFKVDDKGRVSLPSKFRKVISKDLVVTLNPDDECLWVFDPDEFNRWIDQLFVDSFGKYDSSNKQHIKLRSKLKRRSEDVQIDASGRIMLPAKMRGAVDIDKDVVIVGNTGYFEVWDAKRCDEADEDVDLDLLFH